MGFEDVYFINLDKLNNYQLLICATEGFHQLCAFLEIYRDYKNIEMKIGEFEYENADYDIYCIYNQRGLSFKHIRRHDGNEWFTNTLTEAFIYAWEFEDIEFQLNFDIINDFWKMLNDSDKSIYNELYTEVHSHYW